MKHGISLGDKDRSPWLDRLVKKMDQSKKPVVLAWSALKRSYRDHLRTAKGTVFFLHLQIPQNILLKRLQNRKDHFFSPSLLDDQLLLLEELQAKELGYTVNSESELEKWLSVQFEQKKDGHLPKWPSVLCVVRLITNKGRLTALWIIHYRNFIFLLNI